MNLLPKIIPKKFTKKVRLADIKQYLVEEFDNNKELQNLVYTLQDELKIAKEYEVKYELSLATLEEYKNRKKTVEDRNKQLETQIKELQNKIKEEIYKQNDLKLENRKMNNYIKNIEKNIRKGIIKEYKEKINNLKGHIKKEDLLDIFKK